MNYLYYPGCSLRSTGKPYDESLRATFTALGVTLEELNDWNCCGATAYISVDEAKAFALSARNLCLAERQAGSAWKGPVNLVTPCSACYSLTLKTQHYLVSNPEVRKTIEEALEAIGLRCEGRVQPRHPLDVLVNDIGLEKVKARVAKPLDGLRVACYYGCAIVRPYATFDSQWNPTSMDRLVEALGGTPIDWTMKTRCCGGALTGTIREVGLRLNQLLLKEAKRKGADILITTCPLCQFDLECFQDDIKETFKEDISMPVAYFTQLVGLSFGIAEKELGVQRLFVQPGKMQKSNAGGQVNHV
jgi:heterodisulfide reductase subunit B